MYWECYYTTNDTIYWSLMVIMDCNDTYTHLIYIHHICVWLRLIGCRSNDRWYVAKTSRLTIQRHGNDGQLMAQYYICSYVDNTYVFVMSIQNIPSILILLLIMKHIRAILLIIVIVFVYIVSHWIFDESTVDLSSIYHVSMALNSIELWLIACMLLIS